MLRYCLPLTLLCLHVAAPAQAAVHAYEAPLDTAAWTMDKSAGGCRLSQDIPYYGRAEFLSRGSKQIEFALSLERGNPGGADWAVVRTVAPLWQPGVPSQEIGTVAVQGGARPFRLASALAWRLLAELEQGMFPTFYLGEGDYRRDQVSVALSAVNFRDGYRDFLACMGKVVVELHQAAESAAREAAKPLDSVFDPVAPDRATVFFSSASDELTASAREVLDKIAGAIKQAPKLELVIVDGHTDDRGGTQANTALAQRRAEAVKNYLVGTSGIEGSRVRTRSYGERYPAVPNDTPAGLARNRRVLLLVQSSAPAASGATAPPTPGSGDVIEQVQQAVDRLSPVQQATQAPSLNGEAVTPEPENKPGDQAEENGKSE